MELSTVLIIVVGIMFLYKPSCPFPLHHEYSSVILSLN